MSVYEFKEGLKESKLKGRKCNSCGSLMLPPRRICPRCGTTDLNMYEFTGEGVLKTKTMIYMSLPRFAELSPYSVGIVQLDEGPTISGMILGEVDKIKIGDRVKAVYLDEGSERILAFTKSHRGANSSSKREKQIG